MKSLIGQYECMHRSGLGLDYFTARLDRLTLYANGRFVLARQHKSRLMHAAKNLASGQQAGMDAPESSTEGNYRSQGTVLLLQFDSGEQEQAQIQQAGLQFGNDFFEKVADTTFMPPQQRLQSNMEDIAKGLKIAGAIGGTVLKAAKAIQDTLQTSQPASTSGTSVPQQSQPEAQQVWQVPPTAPPGSTPSPAAANGAFPQDDETLFCDQCGAPVRPGKRFCGKCGARLP